MKFRLLFVAATSVAVLSLTAFAAKKVDLENVKCVMNPKAAAKAEKSVDYKGGKVFFCCDNCPKGFAKKIKEGNKVVAAKGNHQLVATGQAKQVKCPFSGGAAKKATAISVAGAKIAFCCENCQGKAKKMEGDEQLVALFGDAAFKKAGFKVAKSSDEEFTSEGAEDPNSDDDEKEPEFTSEGAEDPNEDDGEKDPELTSEGAEDPNEDDGQKDPELTSEGAEDPNDEDDDDDEVTSEGADDPAKDDDEK